MKQFPSSVWRLEQSETDSGCHLQDSEEDVVTELQARLAEMETELRVLRDENTCQYLSLHDFSHSKFALLTCNTY